jgi:hypothetical protein
LLQVIDSLSSVLSHQGYRREADALHDVWVHSTATPDFGGLGVSADQTLTPSEEEEILFLVSAQLEALNSQDRHGEPLAPLLTRPAGRRGMTLAEKIFAAHDVERKGSVRPGDVICVNVDWVMASELSWSVCCSVLSWLKV